MAVYLDPLGPVMQDILDCADNAMRREGRGLGLVSMTPGAGPPPMDNCCDGGGQLYIRVSGMHPSGRPYPAMDATQPGGCLTLYAAHLAIGAVRCAHTLDAAGNPPTGAQMTQDVLKGTRDAFILQGALTCCVNENLKLKLGAWSPIGPTGGCAGGEWDFWVAIDTCGCPEEA